jgi:hypothetical protein
MSRKTPPCGDPRPALTSVWMLGVAIPLEDPAVGLLLGGRRLLRVELVDVREHEALAVLVAQRSPLAAHALRDQRAAHRRRPHHPGGVKLHELHVHELGAGEVRERLPVPRALPRVRVDLEGAADPAGGDDHRLALEDDELPRLAPVAEGPRHAVVPRGAHARRGEEARHGALHVDGDPEVDPVLLERADHLEAGAVAHVREARVFVAAEVSLEDAAVLGAIEDRAPLLELVHAVGRLHRVELRHAPLIQVATPLHRVAEVDLPVVLGLDVAQRGGDAPFGHDGVRLAEERLAHEAHAEPGRGRLDGRAQTCAARADDQDVVLVRLVLRLRHVNVSLERRAARPRRRAP